MQPIPIQSSNVAAVHYAEATQALTVWFRSGGVYEYQAVAESLYQSFLAAQPHPWTVYGRVIKAHAVRRIS